MSPTSDSTLAASSSRRLAATVAACDIPQPMGPNGTPHTPTPSARSAGAALQANDPPSFSLEWERLDDLPVPVRAATAASHRGLIYVLGGNLTLSDWTTLNQIYDPRTDTWRSGAPFEGERDFAMAEALSDGVHLIAGRDARFKMDHQPYDPGADAWTFRAPLPAAIDAAAVERFGNRIYVIGGNDLNRPIGTVHIYHPAHDEWTTGAPMPTPRFSAASAVHRGRILVAGGQLAGRETSNALEAYHAGRDQWEPLAPMPFDSEALGGGTVMRGGMVGNRFCVFGGRLAGSPPSGMAFSNTFCYDTARDTWSRGPDMLTPRVETAFVEHAGAVYAIGGRSRSEIASAVVSRSGAVGSAVMGAPGSFHNR